MADRFYGINRGGKLKDVSESASTTSLDVEVRFELISGMSREEVMLAIDYISQAILRDTYPPA